MKKKKGFTLTEMLIALVLLGVIAAVTIPVLLTGTNKSIYVNGLKRAYLIMKTATGQLMLDNGGTMKGLAANTDDSALRDKYCTKLNCIKKCNSWGVLGSCYASQTYLLNGSAQDMTFASQRAGGVLANGMIFITIASYAATCDHFSVKKSGVNVGCAHIIVDVNGFKGPNTMGRDIFIFNIYNGGIIPAGVEGTYDGNGFSLLDWFEHCTSDPGRASDGCAGRVLTEGAMNY